MARYSYERLTALDHSFLFLERPNTPMHVGSVAIHELGALESREGGVDVELLRRGIAGVLHRIPRYRQRLDWVPIEGTPVWVDDEGFNLDYHVRHTSLPRPGDAEQLRQLTARVMAQRLDRSRPLWEMWVVEGLEANRFALLSKVHHCMIDGVSGVDLMNVLMSPSPDAEIFEPSPFVPRPAPSRGELLRDEALRRAFLPLAAMRDLGKLVREAHDVRHGLGVRTRALRQTLGGVLHETTPTPLNEPLSPHRRFDWLVLDLDAVKAVRRALGGSLNDVVLTTVAGAVRRFLDLRRVPVQGLDFRVMAPVSVRAENERGRLGNRVSAWILPLPLAEPDPALRLRTIAAHTEELKQTHQTVAAEVLTQVAEWTPATLLALGARNTSRQLPFHGVVTNVPGPQLPLYLFGSRMIESYPVVPLPNGIGLGIALFSYDGKLCWGFNADWDLVPDLDRFVNFVAESLAELREVALGAGGPKKRRRPARRTTPRPVPSEPASH
ncbi:MAG: wax ester/triacylglycerol synthase family O-acyltransferase [Myxococcota bacterium]